MLEVMAASATHPAAAEHPAVARRRGSTGRSQRRVKKLVLQADLRHLISGLVANGFNSFLCWRAPLIKRLIRNLRLCSSRCSSNQFRSDGHRTYSLSVLQRSDPNINPDNWWALFGYKKPHLQALARRVLNLTCTSSQLEKCWNTFEKVFYDKDFEPDPKVRSKFMFAHANLKLEEKWERKHKDPLAAYQADNAYAWIADTVSEDDDIVAPVTGLELDSELDQNSDGLFSTKLKVTDESYDSDKGEGDCGIDVEDDFDEDDTLGTGTDRTGEDEHLGSLDNVKDWN